VHSYEMKKIAIFCDGEADGNPGPGGWTAILIEPEGWVSLGGGDPLTTKNQMELEAVIWALRALPQPCEVLLFTDSVYVRDAMSKFREKQNAQESTIMARTRAKNEDLWKELDAENVWTELSAETAKHDITCQWFKADTGDGIVADINDVCDDLAKLEIEKGRLEVDLYELEVTLNEELKKSRD